MDDPSVIGAQAPPATALNGSAPAPDHQPPPAVEPDSAAQNIGRDVVLCLRAIEDVNMRLTALQVQLALVAGLVLLAIAAERIARRHAAAS